MFENAIEVIKLIEKKGYKAYIVGGYVRDIYLSINSTDIDICTSAKPKDLVKIFKKNIIIDENYGAVKLKYKNNVFDITTFRKDIIYKDNRRPSEVEYVEELEEDLYRRDFTINTMCMDSDGNIIDFFNAKKEISEKVIKSVGDPFKKIEEDSLRILRAIRFACTLNFKIEKKLDKAIKKNTKSLINLSFHRKKYEINRIFRSKNYEYGMKLIHKYRLEKYLGLSKLSKIKQTSDVLGMWAQVDYSDEYPFSKLEKESIKNIRELLIYGKIDSFALYKYGNCIPLTVAEIKNIDKKTVLDMYDNLPIHSKEDIDISVIEICELLNITPGKKTKDILSDLEYCILSNKLENKKDILKDYVINKFGGDKK
ncbi:MAG: hypothetical protein J6O56_00035 [Bacilli bacterium]|nr:hypothetical protein [Bacilli bacterium]